MRAVHSNGPFYFATYYNLFHDLNMTLFATLFWSFRSPYSYLATARYASLCKKYDLHIDLRPVYPLAIREADFFEKNHPNWLSYTVRDIVRLAQFHDIPFSLPQPDPIVQNMMTRKISADQPFIYGLTRLGQAATRRRKSLEFCDAVSRHIWGGTKGWNEGDHLKNAALGVGLDWDELHQEVINDADALDNEIGDNQKALEASGHWGVPTLLFNDEPFFGQDRIDLALWRMQQAGLKKR